MTYNIPPKGNCWTRVLENDGERRAYYVDGEPVAVLEIDRKEGGLMLSASWRAPLNDAKRRKRLGKEFGPFPNLNAAQELADCIGIGFVAATRQLEYVKPNEEKA